MKAAILFSCDESRQVTNRSGAAMALLAAGTLLPFQSLARSAGLISPFDEGCLSDVTQEAATVLGL